MIEKDGGKAVAAIADIADETAVGSFVDAAMRHWGKIDILCNNAGIMDEISLIEDVSTELWNRVFAVNVTVTFFVSRTVLPHIRQREQGVIVNTASLPGLRGGAPGGPSVVSKPSGVGITPRIAGSLG